MFYDYYLIKDILKINKHVLISTGVSDLDDIDIMVNLLKKERNRKISLLHCRSLYPTINTKLHLSRIKYFSKNIIFYQVTLIIQSEPKFLLLQQTWEQNY